MSIWFCFLAVEGTSSITVARRQAYWLDVFLEALCFSLFQDFVIGQSHVLEWCGHSMVYVCMCMESGCGSNGKYA